MAGWERIKNLIIVQGLFILILSSVLEAASCKYSTFTEEHTMCKFPEFGCKVSKHGVSSTDRDLIVKMHNDIRQSIASGKGRRKQPPASNMEKMEWDVELATIAQRLTNQCKGKSDCAKCREVERFHVGQNIRHRKRTFRKDSSESMEIEWEKTVLQWYERADNFSQSSITSYTFNSASSTYSQIVWAETSRIGCGYSNFLDGNWNVQLYICNYGPGGNIIEDQVYKIGQGCSDCPEGFKCSKKYPSLCERTT